MNSIHRLVALQRHRLTQDERRLREARRRLIELQTEQDRCRTQLYAHRTMAKQREHELYASVFDHVVKITVVQQFRETLAALQRREQQLEEALVQTNRNVVEQEGRVDAAQQMYTRQMARTEKYLELQRRQAAVARQVLQYKEELEIEELPLRA